MDVLNTIINSVQSFAFLFLRYIWLWFFVVLVLVTPAVWLTYVQEYYKRSQKWVLLELRIPRELKRQPRAMEQVFMTLHAIKNSADSFEEWYWDGEVTLWTSWEIASFGGDIHMYARVPAVRRNLIEAALYGQYPDIELAEMSEDYVNRLPTTYDELRASGKELFGNELVLEKADGYPLRTYIDFEEIDENRQLDNISVLLETMAKLKPHEILWLQILCRPKTDKSWTEEGEKLIEQIKEKSSVQRQSQYGIFSFPDRTPGDIELMKAVERNVSKPGFDVVLRYLYVSPKTEHDSSFGRRSILSAMNQYASESMNRFKHNQAAWTLADVWYFPYLFPKRRSHARRQRIWRYYRERHMPSETRLGAFLDAKWYHLGIAAWKKRMVLNTEELATIYHPPTFITLTGPILKRVEARKAGPPAGLPIYDNEQSSLLPGESKE